MGAIQTFARKEIKFLLTEQQYQDFLPLLEHYMNPDKFCVGGKEYGIYNVYYDTSDDFLIRESLEKPDYKEKIRLRSYLSPAQPEDTVFLEIKKKICGIVNKRRVTMTLAQAEADFAFVQNLPGQKILLKGNHDYWWASKKKMDDFFTAHGFNTLHILHNNHYAFGQYGICGTRGWVSMQGEAADAKILAREVQRLQVSIQSAVDAGLEPIVFLHYPPIYGMSMNYEILEVLHKYQIRKCYYGHVHGKSGHNHAFQGMYEGTEMRMISSDYLQFVPEQIL